ncbi:hypothetical protein OB13_05070 [Pontibacter sp. HJ8]
MKKIFYSIGVVSVMLFASCTEDRGTTTEVADANKDETVNPNQIRGYGEEQTAASDMDTEAAWRQNSEQLAGQMATDLKLDTTARKRVQQVLFERERRMGELEDRYNYTETNRMGGQANNDTRNDTSKNPSTNLDAKRPNNQGNAYRGNSNMNDGNNNNLQMRETEMNSERERIQANTEKELKAILSPEQFKKFEQNRASYTGMNPGSGVNPVSNPEN